MLRSMAVLGILAGTSPAAALTCDAFLDGLGSSTYANLLPDIATEENDDLPGLFAITNLRHIEAGFTCLGGRFDGLGATLYEGEAPDLARWTAFVGAVVETVAPEEDEVLELVARLQDEAMGEARLEEVRTGFWVGRASDTRGDYEIAIEVYRGGVRFDVDTAE